MDIAWSRVVGVGQVHVSHACPVELNKEVVAAGASSKGGAILPTTENGMPMVLEDGMVRHTDLVVLAELEKESCLAALALAGRVPRDVREAAKDMTLHTLHKSHCGALVVALGMEGSRLPAIS